MQPYAYGGPLTMTRDVVFGIRNCVARMLGAGRDRKMSAIARKIGQRIAQLRRRAGFTQAQLAESCGVQPETVCRYEAGVVAVPIDRLVLIAKALRLRVQDLLDSPSDDPVRDRAVERLLVFAGTLTTEEIELVMDVGAAAVKHLQKARLQ